MRRFDPKQQQQQKKNNIEKLFSANEQKRKFHNKQAHVPASLHALCRSGKFNFNITLRSDTKILNQREKRNGTSQESSR
jgi:hypothetical protein